MNKIMGTIDLTKIDKERIRVVEKTNDEGETVVQKMYDFDIVELKPEKQTVITSGDTWELKKTHFITDSPTKEERAARTKMNFIGGGKSFSNPNEQPF